MRWNVILKDQRQFAEHQLEIGITQAIAGEQHRVVKKHGLQEAPPVWIAKNQSIVVAACQYDALGRSNIAMQLEYEEFGIVQRHCQRGYRVSSERIRSPLPELSCRRLEQSIVVGCNQPAIISHRNHPVGFGRLNRLTKHLPNQSGILGGTQGGSRKLGES